MIKLLCLFAIVIFQVPAHADSANTQFVKYLQSSKGLNVSSVETTDILNFDNNVSAIDNKLNDQLLVIAQTQATTWDDTILEQDVAALGEIRLDQVEELSANNELQGYRITYSQRGWDTSTCDLSRASVEDYKHEETFANCAEGRIYESAYVSTDLNTYFTDDDNLAHLVLK